MLYVVDNDESMTLDTLDGYLHAIAIGPETIMPRQWLPKVWGEDSAMMPSMDNIDQLNHIMGLVMRHYNSIISGFEQSSHVGALSNTISVNLKMPKCGHMVLPKVCNSTMPHGSPCLTPRRASSGTDPLAYWVKVSFLPTKMI